MVSHAPTTPGSHAPTTPGSHAPTTPGIQSCQWPFACVQYGQHVKKRCRDDVMETQRCICTASAPVASATIRKVTCSLDGIHFGAICAVGLHVVLHQLQRQICLCSVCQRCRVMKPTTMEMDSVTHQARAFGQQIATSRCQTQGCTFYEVSSPSLCFPGGCRSSLAHDVFADDIAQPRLCLPVVHVTEDV